MTTRRDDVERELAERARDEKRQASGSTPTEDVMERALGAEPGVERHAGEDAGQVPPMEEDLDELGAGRRTPTGQDLDELGAGGGMSDEEREAAARGDPT